jgi:hypothetical protein
LVTWPAQLSCRAKIYMLFQMLEWTVHPSGWLTLWTHHQQDLALCVAQGLRTEGPESFLLSLLATL